MQTATELSARAKNGEAKIATAIANGRAKDDPEIIEARAKVNVLRTDAALRRVIELEAQSHPVAEQAQAGPVAKQAPTARPRGKVVRGVHYASKPRETPEVWYYRKMPEAVLRLVEGKQLNPIDGMFAGIISRHLDTHRRSKSDDHRRITYREIAATASREESSAKRSVSRMVDAGALIVVSSGHGNQRGALYSFPGRSA